MRALNLTRLPRASKISYFSDRLLGTIFFLTEPNAHVVTIVATIAYKLWSSGMIPF